MEQVVREGVLGELNLHLHVKKSAAICKVGEYEERSGWIKQPAQ
jgi:hypothetical protein